jgi:hypothetical protein
MSNDEGVRSEIEQPTGTLNAEKIENAELDEVAGGAAAPGAAGAGALMAVGETGIS